MNLAQAQTWIQFIESTIARVARELRLERVAQPLLDDLAFSRINSNRLAYDQVQRQSDEGEEIQVVYLLIDALSAVYARFIVPAALINHIHTSRVQREAIRSDSGIDNPSELPSAPTYPWGIYSMDQADTLARVFTLMLDATIDKIFETSEPSTARRATVLIRNYFSGE